MQTGKNFKKKKTKKIILNLWRIGHVRITYGFVTAKKGPLIRETCEVTISPKHVLMECTRQNAINFEHFK